MENSVLCACQRAESTKTRVRKKNLVWFDYYFEANVIDVPPPNHISNKMEGGDLDNCDLIY